jgi:hypothetical protein
MKKMAQDILTYVPRSRTQRRSSGNSINKFGKYLQTVSDNKKDGVIPRFNEEFEVKKSKGPGSVVSMSQKFTRVQTASGARQG